LPKHGNKPQSIVAIILTILSAATLVPIFLAGCRDSDPLVRASSLSNLGELCELLHYALLPYLEEIVACVQSLLQTDATVEVRRGEHRT